MSTSFNDNVKLKSDLNLYNIEADSLLNLSFNFDILKYVITELIKNQKNNNDEISKIKSELQQQKNYTNEIESSLLQFKLSSEKNFGVQQNLEEYKIKLGMELNNVKNEIKNKEKNEDIKVKEIINEQTNNNKIFINKKKTMNAINMNDNNKSKINNENKEKNY